MSECETVELTCSPEEVWRHYETRQKLDADFSGYKLPARLPDDPSMIFERIKATEEWLIPRGDYSNGSATVANHILPIAGSSGVLLTAEHATDHIRSRADGTIFKKDADAGTGALAAMVGAETQSDALIAIGRQTSDANRDNEHLLKKMMHEVISRDVIEADISIHGMGRAIHIEPKARRGIPIMLGVGYEPSDATSTFVYDHLVKIGSDYDLDVRVNQPFIAFDFKAKRPLLNEDGTVKTKIFAAPAHTTRGYAQSVAKELGKNDSFVAVQIELSSVLRHLRDEKVVWPTHRDRVMGAYLGYLFVKAAVESVSIL